MLTIVHEFPCALYGDTELHESIYHMVVALHCRMKHYEIRFLYMREEKLGTCSLLAKKPSCMPEPNKEDSLVIVMYIPTCYMNNLHKSIALS